MNPITVELDVREIGAAHAALSFFGDFLTAASQQHGLEPPAADEVSTSESAMMKLELALTLAGVRVF